MPHFERSSSAELLLSSETISEIRQKLGSALILKGRIEETQGVFSIEEQAIPRSFRRPLSREMLQDVGLIGVSDEIDPEGCEALFTTPCSLDPADPTAQWQSTVTVAVTTRFESAKKENLFCAEVWYIGAAEGDVLKGERSVEFSDGKKRISPGLLSNDLFDNDSLLTVDDPKIGKLLDDLDQLSRPLSIDDRDKLLSLAQAIRESPRLLDEA